MLTGLRRSISGIFEQYRKEEIPLQWVKKNRSSWLLQQFSDEFVRMRRSTYSSRIEQLAQQTNESGPQPLWEGYAGHNIGGPTRTPNGVRIEARIGNFFTFLVRKRKPNIVVEFGTAFGVSGMYFLAGIEWNRKGRLLTFEPNQIWAKAARANLSEISERFDLIVGIFEENIDNSLRQGEFIDMAFVDAIHTREFLIPQIELVITKSSSETIIILDDINFSENMRNCWKELSNDIRFSATALLGERVGILELSK